MSTKEYFRKPYMTQGITKHSDYMKAIPQKAIDVQGQIAPNIEFKKPYDFTPNTAQMIHYYSNQLHYLGGDPVPPINDPSLLPHAPVLETPVVTETKTATYNILAGGDDCDWAVDESYFTSTDYFCLGLGSPTRNKSCRSYLRFTNVAIPIGAVIENAYISFYSLTASSIACIVKIYCNAIGDSSAPTTAAGGNALAVTSQYVDWNVGAWVSPAIYDTPNIKTVIQAIIDRSDWKERNDLGIIFYDNSSIGTRTSGSFGSGYTVPKLTVIYSITT